MPTKKTTALVLDLAHARVLEASLDDVGNIVAFSPDAGTYLRSRGLNSVSVESLLPAFSHARNVVVLRRLLTHIRAQLLSLPCHTAEVQALTVHLFNLLGSTLLLRATLRYLGEGPYLIVQSGRAQEFVDRRSALRALATEVRPDLRQFTTVDYSRLHGMLAQTLSWLIAAVSRNRVTITHLDFGNPVPRRFVSLLESVTPDLLVTYARTPRRTMLDTVVRGVRSLVNYARRNPRAEVHIFRASSDASRQDVPASLFDQVSVGDPELDDVIRDALRAVAPLVRMENFAGAAYARVHQPNAAVLDNFVFPATIRAAMDLASRGTKIVLINHGSHSLPVSRLSRMAGLLWAEQGRVTAECATDLICKTPQVAKVAEELGGAGKAVHPLKVYDRVPRDLERNQDFTIVLAGNFMPVRLHVPWITELPGEFLRGSLDVAEAVRRVDGVRLIIKMKARKDAISIAHLEDEIGKLELGDKVVVDKSTSLTQLFARTDLVISNLSTTIDEALTSGIPVLLHTWRRHYFHVPARHEPPTETSRAAVYGALPGRDLAAFLSAIRDCHRTPLSEDETQGLVWRESDYVDPKHLIRDWLRIR